MSLDVCLIGAKKTVACTCECGHVHSKEQTDYVFEANITHNLGGMADAAGIYYALWRPEEIGVTKAGQLIELLTEGLAKLKADPEHFKGFNAKNGWGTYTQFIPWVEKYLNACKENPDALIEVSR